MSKERENYNKSTVTLAYVTDNSVNTTNTISKPLKVFAAISSAFILSTSAGNLPYTGTNTFIQDMVSINYPYVNLGDISQKNSEQSKKDVIVLSVSGTSQNVENAITSGESTETQREVEILKHRLSNCLPMHALFYIVFNTVVSSISLTLIIVRFALNIFIIDPYYLICALIISLTLLATSLASLKSWKAYLER